MGPHHYHVPSRVWRSQGPTQHRAGSTVPIVAPDLCFCCAISCMSCMLLYCSMSVTAVLALAVVGTPIAIYHHPLLTSRSQFQLLLDYYYIEYPETRVLQKIDMCEIRSVYS